MVCISNRLAGWIAPSHSTLLTRERCRQRDHVAVFGANTHRSPPQDSPVHTAPTRFLFSLPNPPRGTPRCLSRLASGRDFSAESPDRVEQMTIAQNSSRKRLRHHEIIRSLSAFQTSINTVAVPPLGEFQDGHRQGSLCYNYTIDKISDGSTVVISSACCNKQQSHFNRSWPTSNNKTLNGMTQCFAKSLTPERLPFTISNLPVPARTTNLTVSRGRSAY